jgi:threonine dehydrogenase-like Zn-dependent dehydrogenase
MYGQCLGGGGWILGHRINGTQVEHVRVPFADNSTYPVPAGRESPTTILACVFHGNARDTAARWAEVPVL